MGCMMILMIQSGVVCSWFRCVLAQIIVGEEKIQDVDVRKTNNWSDDVDLFIHRK